MHAQSDTGKRQKWRHRMSRDLQGQGVKRVWVRGRGACALEGTNVVPVITVLRVVEVESPPCVGEGNVSFNAKSCVHCRADSVWMWPNGNCAGH
jgi:hypothetical protein